MNQRIGTLLQTFWDQRAAGNFMFGGAGSSLLLLTAIAVFSGAASFPLPGVLALVLIAAGLGLVWLELGRPWRALNVFFHPQTSWMTREAIVALLVFLFGLAAAVFQSRLFMVLAAAAGLVFLYCQARILKASKGIPTWREPALVPLVHATGLAEAAGILSIVLSLAGSVPAWLKVGLLGLVLVRVVTWKRYQSKFYAPGVPKQTVVVLAEVDRVLSWAGSGLPIALSVVALAFTGGADFLMALAGAGALLGGWFMKYSIVTRAAQVQGYTLGVPRRRGVTR